MGLGSPARGLGRAVQAKVVGGGGAKRLEGQGRGGAEGAGRAEAPTALGGL